MVVALGAVALMGAAELALRARHRQRVLPPTPPAPGTVTLVALGDSITAGSPGDVQAAWPTGLLAHLHDSHSDVTWRMVNAGVPGDTAPLGDARFDRDAAAAGPQAVLIGFGLNDCYPDRHGLDRWLEGRLPVGLSRSYVWRAIRSRAARTARRLGWPSGAKAEPQRKPVARTTPAGFATALTRLVACTREIDAQPVLLTMTPLAMLDVPGVTLRRATYPVYNAAIRRVAAGQRTPLVDLATGAPPDAFEPDGFHLTAAGQAWAAGQVFSQLQTVGFWAGLGEIRRRDASLGIRRNRP